MPKKQESQYYLGNQNLPTTDAVFDYEAHPEWVKISLNVEKIFYILQKTFSL